MGELHIVATLFMVAIILVVILMLCHTLDIWPRLSAWVFSNTEEKIGLTKLKGLYNANGYLVKSNSDLKLFASGSFKRFDSVDRDFKETLATTSLTEKWKSGEENNSISSQSLRPAPTSASVPSKDSLPILNAPSGDDSTGNTLTIAIPRPRSSVSVAELASKSSFPICLTPPPTPLTPLPTSAKPSSPQSAQPATALATNSTTPSEETEVPITALQRATSFDSVSSDTSVALADLEEPNITGYLCLGLEYDSENSFLFVNVLEAKELLGSTKEDMLLDTYVRVFLLPEKISNAQTRVYRSSRNPSYKERFLFELHPREQSQKSLCFQVYSTSNLSHTLIGEGEFKLNDASLRQPVTTWITLTDTGQKTSEFGEIMFSLSYLPTAERLTVVVVKARNLKFQNDKDPGDPFVKVYLLQNGKKLQKKKTSSKKGERCPIFNESIIFNVPAHLLQTIQLRLTVSEAISNDSINGKSPPIGHVIVGAQASGRSLTHWTQMLTTLRKPVAMWHSLRK